MLEHSKGVVAAHASGALSWEMAEQINLKTTSNFENSFLSIYIAAFIQRSYLQRLIKSVVYYEQFYVIVSTRKSINSGLHGHSASVASRPSLPQRKSLKSKLSRYEALQSFTATNFLLRSGQCALHSKLCLKSFFVCHMLLSVVKTWTLYVRVLELNFLSCFTLSKMRMFPLHNQSLSDLQMFLFGLTITTAPCINVHKKNIFF